MPASTTSAVIVNFSQFRLEEHVQKSFQNAWSLSAGQPLNASHLLKGALLVARPERVYAVEFSVSGRGSSKAFLELASLLRLPKLPYESTTGGSPADLAALALTKPLADSFSIAEGFLKDKAIIWGRDYVTLALLAKDDPSLDQITSEASTSTQTVRDDWYKFVTSSRSRRTREDWQRWWRAAGVALPPKGRATPDSRVDGETAVKPAYLFTWNPKGFPVSRLEEHIQELGRQGFTTFTWGAGTRGEMAVNDRVFLLGQGLEPRGLVGVGEIQREVVEGPTSNETRRKEGTKAFLVEVRWRALSREPFLALSRLVQETGDSKVWSSQSGGIRLEPIVSQRLEEIWPRAWAEHMRDLRTPLEVENREWIARFNADQGVKADSLELKRYVNAFARVMASRSLTPPLSIGLFGDWGSGKTFFMDRLFDRIKELQGEDGNPSVYWRNICQIRFNAWHYAETDLWGQFGQHDL